MSACKIYLIYFLTRLRARRGTTSVRSAREIFNEFEILTKLAPHPHIVEAHELLHDGSSYHLLLELCEEGDLHSKILNKGKLPQN